MIGNGKLAIGHKLVAAVICRLRGGRPANRRLASRDAKKSRRARGATRQAAGWTAELSIFLFNRPAIYDL